MEMHCISMQSLPIELDENPELGSCKANIQIRLIETSDA